MFWHLFSLQGPAAVGQWGDAGQPYPYVTVSDVWAGRNMRVRLRTHGRKKSSLIQMGTTLEVKRGNNWMTEWPAAVAIPSFGPITAGATVTAVKPDNATIEVLPETSGGLVKSITAGNATRLKLDAVTFTGPGNEYIAVRQDASGLAYTTLGPHWTKTNSYPALYVSGSKVRASVGFTVERERFAETVVVKGVASSGSTSFTLWATSTIPANATNWGVTTTADTALASNKVDFFNKMKIKWSYAAFNTTDFQPVGTSENQVYVTLRTPVTTELRHTIAHLACSTPGATDDDTAVANTWAKFSTGSGPAGVTTWDGKLLYYYKAGFPSLAASLTAGSLLENTNLNGQCGAFKQLLGYAWLANGVSAWTNIEVLSPEGSGGYFLVKHWSFGATNDDNPEYPWLLTFANGRPDLVPTGNVGGTVANTSALPGQNSPVPAANVFNNHQLNLYGTNYFDPSYGKVFLSEADFESNAVAGHGIPLNSGAQTNLVLRIWPTGFKSNIVEFVPR